MLTVGQTVMLAATHVTFCLLITLLHLDAKIYIALSLHNYRGKRAYGHCCCNMQPCKTASKQGCTAMLTVSMYLALESDAYRLDTAQSHFTAQAYRVPRMSLHLEQSYS